MENTEINQNDENQFCRIITYNYPNGIILSDKDGNILFTNQSRNFAIEPSFLSGKNLNELVKDGIYNKSAILETIKKKMPVVTRIERKSKSDAITSTKPIFDDKGNIEYVVSYTLPSDEIYKYVRTLESKLDSSAQIIQLFSNRTGENSVVYASLKMKQTIEIANMIADTDSSVMIFGETGSGKEVIARHIHNNSKRKNGLFIPINCAAIPSELLESEFFGYEPGSFTGALSKGKAGLFELSNNGTLFLDEIGDLPLSMQSKLLRVLDSGEVKRIGGSKIIKTDVRILAATNKDLLKMVGEGSFRQDLYYRICTIPISIPPLRERFEDVEVLANSFVQNLNNKYGQDKFFTEKSLRELSKYSWPGNVRELKNVVERAYITTKGEILHINHLLLGENDYAVSNNICSSPLPLKKSLKDYEEALIKAALQRNKGNKKSAAKDLGITRASLYKKLEEMGQENNENEFKAK